MPLIMYYLPPWPEGENDSLLHDGKSEHIYRDE